jgi:UDP-N-acetylmuramate dehydrogenase
MRLREHVPLAPFTTLGIGGQARYFASVATVDDLQGALDEARRLALPVFFLGGGSNLLISDSGFPGMVIHIRLEGISIQGDGESASLRAAAGEVWDDIVKKAVDEDLAGIECLSGIPGYVGATPIQNVGAYGQDVAETITAVEVLDRRSGELRTLSHAECEFGYRMSFFKNRDPERYVVLAVTYRLSRGGAPSLKYPELKKYLAEHFGDSPSLRDVRAAVIAIRKRKGMVVDPSDPDSRSAGSFFMNPILDPQQLEEFEKRVSAQGILADGQTIPKFPQLDGSVKVSAAWLIEHAGFAKGFGTGPAGLSTKHTLAIVNRGNATAGDVQALVSEIQIRVRECFGISIHPEPNFVGF